MIDTLLKLTEFENQCLGLIQPAGPAPAQVVEQEEVWCYDFDGVVHTMMNPGENMTFCHRNPDKATLKTNFTDSNFKSLLPYIFEETINHMKYGQSIGAKIVIVSANSEIYIEPIFKILNHVGVEIEESDIHMRVHPKDEKLGDLKCTLFMDDSCDNISTIHKAYKLGKIPTLNELVYVVPEKKYASHYEIDLSSDLTICDKNIRYPKWCNRPKNWYKGLLNNDGVSLLDFSHKIKLLSYNVLYKSFTFGSSQGNLNKKLFGKNIINYINNFEPDIMVLNEASPLIPVSTIGDDSWYNKIELPDYKENVIYHGARGTNGTLIYWSDKFEKEGDKFGVNSTKDGFKNSGFGRPCVGVKLVNKNTGKKYIITN